MFFPVDLWFRAFLLTVLVAVLLRRYEPSRPALCYWAAFRGLPVRRAIVVSLVANAASVLAARRPAR